MKDLTIAQAQANVEARIAGEKRKGERKRKPRQSAVQKAVVAEATRLEQLQAAVAIGAVDSHIGEQMSRHRHANGSPTRKSTKMLLAEWARRNVAAEPKRPQSLAEVNLMLLKLKRQAQMLERDCVMLQQAVFRLQRNGGNHE